MSLEAPAADEVVSIIGSGTYHTDMAARDQHTQAIEDSETGKTIKPVILIGDYKG